MFYTYILELRNGKYYHGFCSDLTVRLKEHVHGKVQTTKNLNPKLVFYAAFKTKNRALNFEKYLKSSSGFAFRNKRLI